MLEEIRKDAEKSPDKDSSVKLYGSDGETVLVLKVNSKGYG